MFSIWIAESWKAWPLLARIRSLESDWWLSLWGFLKLLGMRRNFQLELLCFVGEYHKSTTTFSHLLHCQFPQMWVLLCTRAFNEWVSPLCASCLLPLETRAKISSVRTMLGFCSPWTDHQTRRTWSWDPAVILLTLAVSGRTLTYLTLDAFVYPGKWQPTLIFLHLRILWTEETMGHKESDTFEELCL